jgi:hypothetical protein
MCARSGEEEVTCTRNAYEEGATISVANDTSQHRVGLFPRHFTLSFLS